MKTKVDGLLVFGLQNAVSANRPMLLELPEHDKNATGRVRGGGSFVIKKNGIIGFNEAAFGVVQDALFAAFAVSKTEMRVRDKQSHMLLAHSSHLRFSSAILAGLK
nr:MAG TPA: hypothetical protein [Caudoviricetes sp.]